MCVQVTKTANRFEISSLLEKILLKQVRWCLTFVGLYIIVKEKLKWYENNSRCISHDFIPCQNTEDLWLNIKDLMINIWCFSVVIRSYATQSNASWHVSRMKQEELTPWNYLSVSSVSFVVLLFSFVFTSHILLVTKKWDSINKDTALVDLYRGESEKIKVYKNNLYYFSLDNNIL